MVCGDVGSMHMNMYICSHTHIDLAEGEKIERNGKLRNCFIQNSEMKNRTVENS